ncbi:MAG TPA: SAF domain-containing protein [Candidatus Limnocylindria bacterium]
MIGRRFLLAVAILAGAVAAGIYWGAVQRTAAVVIVRDLDGQRAIEADDIALRDLPPDALPAGAVRQLSEALGRTPRAPLWAGQVIVASALADAAAVFGGAIAPQGGLRAIAIPATPGLAVGGAFTSGARVDVVAVPIAGRAPTNRVTEVLAAAALVLDVRGESGGPLGGRGAPRVGSVTVPDRLGSVIVAVSALDALRIADRIPVSTFVFVFVPSR